MNFKVATKYRHWIEAYSKFWDNYSSERKSEISKSAIDSIAKSTIPLRISSLKTQEKLDSYLYLLVREDLDFIVSLAISKQNISMSDRSGGEIEITNEQVKYAHSDSQDSIVFPRTELLTLFWLHYIIAIDYWDKYEKLGTEEYRESIKKAVEKAMANLPEAKAAQKMRDEKIEAGEYWEEMAEAAMEWQAAKQKYVNN